MGATNTKAPATATTTKAPATTRSDSTNDRNHRMDTQYALMQQHRLTSQVMRTIKLIIDAKEEVHGSYMVMLQVGVIDMPSPVAEAKYIIEVMRDGAARIIKGEEKSRTLDADLKAQMDKVNEVCEKNCQLIPSPYLHTFCTRRARDTKGSLEMIADIANIARNGLAQAEKDYELRMAMENP